MKNPETVTIKSFRRFCRILRYLAERNDRRIAEMFIYDPQKAKDDRGKNEPDSGSNFRYKGGYRYVYTHTHVEKLRKEDLLTSCYNDGTCPRGPCPAPSPEYP